MKEPIWVGKKELRKLLSVANATIDRWEFEEEYAHLEFPSRFRINGRVFWKYTEIVEFTSRLTNR
jgi:predicted DNA-binding transcriptional regulator AlpA